MNEDVVEDDELYDRVSSHDCVVNTCAGLVLCKDGVALFKELVGEDYISMQLSFSLLKSLIIHQVITKKITIVKEAWISGLH